MEIKYPNIKISAFCLMTNAIDNGFPFIESIQSFLPILDELVVVDGGSTDGTIKAIKALNNSKIRIIQDKDTKWEEEWFYGRMGHNFNRGLQECTGDWAIKFDVDYILHEKFSDKIRGEFQKASYQKKLTAAFTRKNFILADRYFAKSKKTLAINKTECKKHNIPLKYGLDLKKWGWGFDFISLNHYKDKVNFGSMIRCRANAVITSATIHNYDYLFLDKEIAKESRWRHYLAVKKQQQLEGLITQEEVDSARKDKSFAWNKLRKQSIENLERFSTPLELEEHPLIIQSKVKSIKPNQQGYDSWGWAKEKAKYYG